MAPSGFSGVRFPRPPPVPGVGRRRVCVGEGSEVSGRSGAEAWPSSTTAKATGRWGINGATTAPKFVGGTRSRDLCFPCTNCFFVCSARTASPLPSHCTFLLSFICTTPAAPHDPTPFSAPQHFFDPGLTGVGPGRDERNRDPWARLGAERS